MTTSPESVIKQSYFYVFSLAGLIIWTIGISMLLGSLLKMQPFTLHYPTYYYPTTLSQYYDNSTLSKYPYPVDGSPRKVAITEADADDIIQRFESARVEEAKNNERALANERNQNWSYSITLLLVGLPLFFAHWMYVRKHYLV